MDSLLQMLTSSRRNTSQVHMTSRYKLFHTGFWIMIVSAVPMFATIILAEEPPLSRPGFSDIVKAVSPAVVFISSERKDAASDSPGTIPLVPQPPFPFSPDTPFPFPFQPPDQSPKNVLDQESSLTQVAIL